jgi:Copine
MFGSICCSNHRYKGEFLTSLNEIQNGHKAFSFFHSRNGKTEGSIHMENMAIQEEHSFLEYLRSGLQISLVVGIDFTGSNGNPSQKSSLHYFDREHGDSLNQYQQTILSVGNILLHYDTDKMVPVYGFGARTNFPNSSLPKNKTLHFFPCSGDFASPAGFGVDGVFELYQHCIKHVTLDGPTFFAPLIKEIVEYARSSFLQDPWAYTVLLIITDGQINDMPATKDIIVEGSYLPLSIIIIGAGDCNFDCMDELDSDDKVDLGLSQLLQGSKKTAARDIVQFVPFRDYIGKPEELAAAVTYELPGQVTSFYRSIGMAPAERVAKHTNYPAAPGEY